MMRSLLVLLFAVLVSGPGVASALEITAYGARPDGSDTTPALNAAVTAALAGPDRTIHVPAGQWTFTTPPATIAGGVSSGVQLVGEGKSNTILTRAYSGGEFLLITGNGSVIRDLSIWAGAGTSGGVAIHLLASDAVGAGGNHRIENVWITSGTGGTWLLPLYLDGANRTLAPVGIRTVRLDNVAVFNATWWAMEWWNAIACEWIGGGAYQGQGTTQAIAVGGPLGQKGLVIADIDQAASTIWAGALRAPIQ
jgi:hypothetical protein